MKNLPIVARRYFQALAACIYFFLGGFLNPRHRSLLYKICHHFGFEKEEDPMKVPTIPAHLRPQPKVPKITPDEICPGPFDISMYHLKQAPGQTRLIEVVLMNHFIRKYSPKTCFEIGTFDGRTTLNMALNSPPETRIFTLDLPASQLEHTVLPIHAPSDAPWIKKERSGAHFVGTKSAEKITQLFGDSATFDFSPYHNSMDFVFIDGAHTYEYVKNDTLAALRLLRNGHGLILWHDYDSTLCVGVTEALNEYYQTDARFRNLRYIEGTILCYLEV